MDVPMPKINKLPAFFLIFSPHFNILTPLRTFQTTICVNLCSIGRDKLSVIIYCNHSTQRPRQWPRKNKSTKWKAPEKNKWSCV